ncbi:hypothetical protein UCREL1_9537 [Eutypa lata UCREL1]|uniref:Secreted protein n=1 Tax=Eutypa lata (strain UCR-EL1) TaxID=1287681 RepID=M7SH93_EUTLA|nr:hypothetical protein UCREL1_9537 [Eutypa lata UCREL1]
MKIAVLAAFALALGSAASVKIPEDSPDGLLVASLDRLDAHYGNFTLIATHVPHEPVPTPPTKRSARLQRRALPLPISDTGCSDDNYVDPVHFVVSRQKLIDECERGTQIGKRSVLAYKIGSSTAYACSYGGRNPCSTDEIDVAFRRIDEDCGSPIKAGWVLMDDWAKSYGREIVTAEICGGI